MKKENNKNFLIITIISSIFIIILIAITTIILVRVKDKNINSKQEVNEYKAVFLISNQVYFGKLEKQNDKITILDDVYYLQVNQTEDKEEEENQQPKFDLIKVGEEFHGPENRLEIMNQNILFIETLRKDSKILEAINNYEKQKVETQK